jgi:hypothetical protein
LIPEAIVSVFSTLYSTGAGSAMSISAFMPRESSLCLSFCFAMALPSYHRLSGSIATA